MIAYLGIDIAKSKFDASLLQGNKYKFKVFKNNIKGFEELYTWLKEKDVEKAHICLESTGIYGEALSYYFMDKGFMVSVVNPAQIKGFAQSELSRNKTDKADSKLIARYCRAINPPAWQPLPPHIRLLQSWVKRFKALDLKLSNHLFERIFKSYLFFCLKKLKMYVRRCRITSSNTLI